MIRNRRGSCILTGGSGGIGMNILRRIISVQSKVILLTRRPESTKRAVETNLGRYAVDVDVIEVDLSDARELVQVLRIITARTDDLDSVIHAAAATTEAEVEVDFDVAHQVGWRSLLQIFEAARPQLAHNPHGRIIAIGSIACETPDLKTIAYATAKTSLHALVRAIARATLNDGMTANLISPSSVNTTFGDRFRRRMAHLSGCGWNEFLVSKLATLPDAKLIDPDTVAYMTEMLLDPSSSHMTGENLRVAGSL